MKNKRIKETLDETFSDLKLFYRDTNLTDTLIENYKVGQIIKEKGFTDMTSIGSGLSGNLRYLIASANAKDISKFNPDSSKIGHFLLDEISFFKVLYIQKSENKTQIFLLHIPDNALSLFKNSTSNIEEEIIEKAKQKFNAKINSPLIPELQTENWKERTKSPIGMNDLGEMFFDDATIKVEEPKRIEINKDKKIIEINKKPWWKIW
ncbi:hypothetical protein [Flavobacterium chungangense]|uniref:Uncharacterized protein n=1 Tax=Flavobacterium chungangense TaxID=554283 RepID=A0A6V6YNU2_9FLAO|nr:hypothetical protein [Flavobacterium chungangense]CAD0001115.1 hypothetical protein FLACHUCJ7_00379 [Flavobacterium chungangense]